MIRYYLVPLVYVTRPMGQMRVPKYIWEMNPPWQGADYGKEDLMLVSADTTDTQHLELSKYSDVWAVPELDKEIGTASLDSLKILLEGFQLPVQWLEATHKPRDILHFIMGMFMLAQRYHARVDRSLARDGVVSDLKWNQLAGTAKDGLTGVIADLKLDATGIAPSMTVREAMKSLADKFPKLKIGGVEV